VGGVWEAGDRDRVSNRNGINGTFVVDSPLFDNEKFPTSSSQVK